MSLETDLQALSNHEHFARSNDRETEHNPAEQVAQEDQESAEDEKQEIAKE